MTADENIEFYTYTPKGEKRHAFVLKGLSTGVTTTEIKEELRQTFGINTYEIYEMKNKNKSYNPMFLITTDNNITLKTLQTEVKYLQFTKIKWERRENNRVATQCRRCQSWGHATSNCHMQPKCARCANGHLTWLCKKEDSEPAKCANCRGEHPASSRECPVYRKIEEQARRIRNPQPQQQPPQQRTYVPAPIPANSPWTGRAHIGQRTAPAQPTPQRVATPPAGAEIEVSTLNNTAGNGFNNLMTELNKLNNKINLSNTIKAIAKLNQLLDGVTDPMQAVQTLQHFAAEVLPHYNILHSTA